VLLQSKKFADPIFRMTRNSEKISIWMKYPSAFALDTKKVELEEMIASEK
jgi:hypothetical protein